MEKGKRMTNASSADDNIWNLRKDLLAAFEGEGLVPVTASAEGMVTVSVDARCQLTSISLQGTDLDSDRRERLERAVLTAVNDGIQQVAIRHAERLNQVAERARRST